jgi:exosome complex component RRP46
MSLRSDGRSENALRPISCELGVLQNCDGSATWKSGRTSILAAVHGPTAPRQSQFESSIGCIVSVVMKSGRIGTNCGSYDTEWESFLTQQLAACIVKESYPRCVISIILQIINDDGSVLAAALHAAVSALLDAAIEMKYLPTAATCYCEKYSAPTPPMSTSTTTSIIILDPTVDEEKSAQAVIVLVFLPKADSLIGCYTTASMRLSAKQLINCCVIASRAVPAIQAFRRLTVEKVTEASYHIQESS